MSLLCKKWKKIVASLTLYSLLAIGSTQRLLAEADQNAAKKAAPKTAALQNISKKVNDIKHPKKQELSTPNFYSWFNTDDRLDIKEKIEEAEQAIKADAPTIKDAELWSTNWSFDNFKKLLLSYYYWIFNLTKKENATIEQKVEDALDPATKVTISDQIKEQADKLQTQLEKINIVSAKAKEQNKETQALNQKLQEKNTWSGALTDLIELITKPKA